MNALNFSQLKNQLQLLIDRNPTATLSWVGDRINEALIDLGNAFRFDSLRRSTYFSILAPPTAGTVTATKGSTAISSASGFTFTQAMVGQKIIIEGQSYGIATWVSTTAVTIDRLYEGTGGTLLDCGIYYDNVQLPWNCDYPRIVSIIDPKNQEPLKLVTKDKYDTWFPNPTSTGTPVFYCCSGYKEDRYPASGTAAAAASTNTTTAIFPTGPYALDDYYNDWYLINTTRTAISRVTDYTGSTLTATISPAITSQVATDTIYMQKRLPYINLYPLPDSAQSLKLTYFTLPNKLINDSDVPFDIPDRFHRAIYLRAAVHSNLIRDDARKSECEKDYNNLLQEMSNEFNYFAGQEFNKQTVDNSSSEMDEFVPYQFPLG